MVHKHADGSEEMRPRTPEEIAAIEEENRIAARSNIRSGQDRRAPGPNMEAMRFFGPHGEHKPVERRKGDRRAILSSFERESLLKESV